MTQPCSKHFKLAVEFRLWLGVTNILELADELGTTIKQHKITNDSEWRAKVTMKEWPNHIEPTNDHRKAFHQCLWESLCRGVRVSAYGAVRDYKSQPLGQ